jgi:radical SAM-linked protein
MFKQRVRIRFRKVGDLRWIGHRDLARTLERIFRRAHLVLATSQGYHPKPRMTFPSPLPLGMEGWNEVVEIQLAQPTGLPEMVARLNRESVQGLEFLRAFMIPASAPTPQVACCVYRIRLNEGAYEEVRSRVAQVMDSAFWPVQRVSRNTVLNLRDHAWEISAVEGELRLRLRPSEAGGPTARDVLESLGLGNFEKDGGVIVREDVILVDEASEVLPPPLPQA